MELISVSKERFQHFSEARDDYNLWQSVDMAEMKEKAGFDVDYLIYLDDSGKELAGTMLVYRLVLGCRQYYAPRGFLIDYQNSEILTAFVIELKKYLRSKKALSLRIDPYFPLFQRNLDGELVEGGFDYSHIVETLKSLGFKHAGYTRGIDLSRECRWIYTIPLENHNEETLLNSFERKTRRSVLRTIKYQIDIKELDESNLNEFIEVMKDTSQRRDFENRSTQYFKDLFPTFVNRGHCRFLSAVLNVDHYLLSLEEDVKREKEVIKECDQKLLNNPKSKKILNKKKISEDLLHTYEEHINSAKQIKSENGNLVTLSAGVFFINKNEIVCLFSGVYEKYMQFSSPYAMHWLMMKYGIQEGIKRYNLYGISGQFDESAPDYGVYLFKKGFMGEVIELLGEFEVSLSPMNYVYHFLRRIKSLLRR